MHMLGKNILLRQSQKGFAMSNLICPFFACASEPRNDNKVDLCHWKIVPLQILHTNSMDILVFRLFTTVTSLSLNENEYRKKKCWLYTTC